MGFRHRTYSGFQMLDLTSDTAGSTFPTESHHKCEQKDNIWLNTSPPLKQTSHLVSTFLKKLLVASSYSPLWKQTWESYNIQSNGNVTEDQREGRLKNVCTAAAVSLQTLRPPASVHIRQPEGESTITSLNRDQISRRQNQFHQHPVQTNTSWQTLW